MDPPVIAVYDANILYPAPLRDLFIRLARPRIDAVRRRLSEGFRAQPWSRSDNRC